MNDQINISYPDGSVKKFVRGVSGFDIAKSISSSLAKDSYVIKVNGDLWDLNRPIDNDASIELLTASAEETLEIIRHDAAHILAMAAKEIFPDIQVTIGPAIDNGFYYDFACSEPFTQEDVDKIEAKMHEIVKRNIKFEREVWDRNEAIKYFENINEKYKAEIISSLPEGEDITIYRQGDFIDLCRGPHAPSTSKIKHFKLTKLAGAYWRGDSNNEMLQRVYGTAWGSKEQLDSYLHMIEEAKKRDHRKLAKELDLFHLQEEAQGMVFWHKNGWSIYKVMQNYIRSKLHKVSYGEVNTPIMLDKKLWEASGHWEKFRDDMFALETEEKIHALKPMSCPGHIQIFKQGTKSYRDLPLKMSEFGSCFRNEASGALHGLMRVRNLVQDDGHIFCTEDQITSQTKEFCQLVGKVYKDFGFESYSIKFSDRPEVRAGSDEVWDKAENALKLAVEEIGLDYVLNPGEGAFYGPKLEFTLTDAIGRQWQCGTIQVDFVLPSRLGAEYIAPGGEKKPPVMLHRAIFGSFERFIGILIENYAGKFPLWLAPTQVAIASVVNDVDDYAREVLQTLLDNGIRAEANLSSDKIGYKVRQFSHLKMPIIAVIGKDEVKEGTLAIRKLGSDDSESVKIDELINMIKEENNKFLK